VLRIGTQTEQALAWEIISEREQPIVEKYGGLHNASAYIGMMPGRGLGVVILGNRGALYPSDAGRNILPELAEREIRPRRRPSQRAGRPSRRRPADRPPRRGPGRQRWAQTRRTGPA